jgi:hypothetical protein
MMMYQKEDENFKKGVDTTKNILKNVKLMNMKLDDITDMVRLQRQKLLNMHKQIEESQNYMNRSKQLIKGFSKELYGDTVIKVLILLITIVLGCIFAASIKYKMKSDLIIGEKDSDDALNDDILSSIDEQFFYKKIENDLYEENKKKINPVFTEIFNEINNISLQNHLLKKLESIISLNHNSVVYSESSIYDLQEDVGLKEIFAMEGEVDELDEEKFPDLRDSKSFGQVDEKVMEKFQKDYDEYHNNENENQNIAQDETAKIIAPDAEEKRMI